MDVVLVRTQWCAQTWRVMEHDGAAGSRDSEATDDELVRATKQNPLMSASIVYNMRHRVASFWSKMELPLHLCKGRVEMLVFINADGIVRPMFEDEKEHICDPCRHKLRPVLPLERFRFCGAEGDNEYQDAFLYGVCETCAVCAFACESNRIFEEEAAMQKERAALLKESEDMSAMSRALEAGSKALQDRERNLKDREQALQNERDAFLKRERNLQDQEQALQNERDAFLRRERTLQDQEQALQNEKDAFLKHRESEGTALQERTTTENAANTLLSLHNDARAAKCSTNEQDPRACMKGSEKEAPPPPESSPPPLANSVGDLLRGYHKPGLLAPPRFPLTFNLIPVPDLDTVPVPTQSAETSSTSTKTSATSFDLTARRDAAWKDVAGTHMNDLVQKQSAEYHARKRSREHEKPLNKTRRSGPATKKGSLESDPQ